MRAQVPLVAGASDLRRALQRGGGGASGEHPGFWVWHCFGLLRPPVSALLPGPSVSREGLGLQPCWWLVCPPALPTPSASASVPSHTSVSVPFPAPWILASGWEPAGVPASAPKLATHKAGVALSHHIPGMGPLFSHRGDVPGGHRVGPGLLMARL